MPSKNPSNHVLYEASVQSPDIDCELFRRIHKKAFGVVPLSMREDFCGTALLSKMWAEQSAKHTALAIDLDQPTLEWAKANRFHKRVTYLQADVLDVKPKAVDMVCALNFSYSVFHEREVLLRYFKNVLRGLKTKGTFVLDLYGGPTAMSVIKETRKVDAGTDDAGKDFPKFKYTWEQARFNFIDNSTTCHIHFKLKGEKKRKKAFTYEWRLYSLPELTDILLEAGFKKVSPYLEGWDDDEDDTDGIFKRRKVYEDMDAFIAYLVATR